MFGMSSEILALRQQDAQLNHALSNSRQANSAALKREEEEIRRAKALAADLLQKHK